MGISITEIKELRSRTNAGMMACKSALEKANGSMQEAIANLRKSGEVKLAKKQDRATKEGVIAICGKVIVKILCETDFVARNKNFIDYAKKIASLADQDGITKARKYFDDKKAEKIQSIGENIILEEIEKVEEGKVIDGYVHSNNKLGALVVLDGGTSEQARDIAMHIVAMDPPVINPENIPQSELDSETKIYMEQLKTEKKPEQIWDKIIAGKLNKYKVERALMTQAFVKNPEQSIAEYLSPAKVLKFIRLAV